MPLSFRRASSADARLFEAWDAEPHVRAAVSADGSRGFGGDWPSRLDDERFAYVVALSETVPVGFVCIVDTAVDPYWGEMPAGAQAVDVIIGDPGRLGRGLGSGMLRWVIERCFSDPSVQAVLVDPLIGNEAAIRFYRRFGFVEEGRRRLGGDDCLVLRLTRRAWTA
jgi:aminoglycoside 6'-N-acetyltransferase